MTITVYLERLRREHDVAIQIDPFDARVLPGSGQIFINRHTTRRLLRLLDTPTADRPVPVVFQVMGEKQTGKSYTRSLIHHLSSSRRFEPVVVELDESSNARHIFDDLAMRVAETGNPDQVYSDHRGQHRFLAQWLVTKARKRAVADPYWFVIDQCDEVDANSEAVEMVTELAKAVQEVPHTEPRRPRLVLLGYDDEFPNLPIPNKQVSVDAIRRVNQSELQDFFDAVFREKAPELAPSDHDIRQYVDVAVSVVLEVAEAAEARGDSYMEALRVAAEEVVDEYSR